VDGCGGGNFELMPSAADADIAVVGISGATLKYPGRGSYYHAPVQAGKCGASALEPRPA
jgi:hypothetical protein